MMRARPSPSSIVRGEGGCVWWWLSARSEAGRGKREEERKQVFGGNFGPPVRRRHRKPVALE